MRIVSVLTSSERGGAEFATVWLLDALCARGHEATLLTDLPGLCDETRVTEEAVEIGPKLSRASSLRLLLSVPRHARSLRRALRDQLPYDVLLLHFKKEQLLTLALPKTLRSVCVWAEWGPLPRQLRSSPANAIFRLAARRSARILAVSEGTRESLVAAGVEAGKVAVLPNAVNAEEHRFDDQARREIRRRLGIAEDAFVVGSMTRLQAKKRNDVLVEALARLGDETHLILAGEGESEAELRRLAEPLAARAHFLPVAGREAAKLISAFDLAVFCPSPTEGAPLSVIIPMLCGRPVVALGPEGARGLIPDGCGVILEPENDSEELARVLAAYRDDDTRRRREGAAAREHAAGAHSAQRVAAEFERIVGAELAGRD